MHIRKQRLYKRIWALLLTVCLLTGCVRGGTTPPGSDETTAPKQDYEVYQKESLAEQRAFSQFCDKLFRDKIVTSSLNLHYTLADPAVYGITDYPITYGDFSLQVMQDDLQKLKSEKAELDSMDLNLLTDDQQLTYRILEKSYEVELGSEGMELYYKPLAPTIGIQAQLPILLSEYAFYDKQDVEEYLTLLSQTDEYFTQLLAFEQEKSGAGLFMTDACLDEVIASCDGYLLPPERSFLAETFPERLAAVTDLTEEEISAFTARNLEILGTDFIPAYELLTQGLEQLRGTGTNDQGMCYYPKGKEYYEYQVKSTTGTTCKTIDELRDAIEDQIDQDLISMSKILEEYPDAAAQSANLPSAKEPNQILDSLIRQIQTDFPELPECTYTIKEVPSALEAALSPAFYLVPPIDRYDSNTIYINRAYTDTADLFPTLAHEGYPGHLYQTVYYSGSCDEKLRQILSFSSYNEGWAFYVENYSYTLDNGLDPSVSQLLAHNASASLGLHALLDLYINYYGWTTQQVAEYMKTYYSIEDSDTVNQLYTAIVATPTNYLAYYVGYLEILKMRSLAEKTLDKGFNLKDFHTFLLDMGPAPFTVIEPYFKTWLMTYPL